VFISFSSYLFLALGCGCNEINNVRHYNKEMWKDNFVVVEERGRVNMGGGTILNIMNEIYIRENQILEQKTVL